MAYGARSPLGSCEDGLVLRSITLGVAISVLAAACALVQPPPPPGTVAVQAEVRNARGPVELTVVTTPGNVLPGAVQPAALPAGSTTDVTFYVPIGGQWWIAINGFNEIEGAEFSKHMRVGCQFEIDLQAHGELGYGCLSPQ